MKPRPYPLCGSTTDKDKKKEPTLLFAGRATIEHFTATICRFTPPFYFTPPYMIEEVPEHDVNPHSYASHPVFLCNMYTRCTIPHAMHICAQTSCLRGHIHHSSVLSYSPSFVENSVPSPELSPTNHASLLPSPTLLSPPWQAFPPPRQPFIPAQ